MSEVYYVIGEFARINKISSRMLRHYDKIHLFKPKYIQENGYRYYSEEQISEISKIKFLRDCDFSLDEIAEIFHHSNELFFENQVHQKLAELDVQVVNYQKKIHLLKTLKSNEFKDNTMIHYGVSMTHSKVCKYLISKTHFEVDQIEETLIHFFELLGKKKIHLNSCALFINTSDKHNLNYVGIEVDSFNQDDDFNYMEIHSGLRLSTLHYGDYYSIGYAYSHLIQYAKIQKIQLESSFMERYFVDSTHTDNPQHYVTEISVMIKNKP